MTASVVAVDQHSVTVQVQVTFDESMLLSEQNIQQALNEAGCLATAEALKQFDSNGSKLYQGTVGYTSKGQKPKRYQTPYGEIEVSRHVYQSAQGGKTYCPLEEQARIMITATPKLAQQVSHKLAQSSSPDVAEDLHSNHGRSLARSYIQKLGQAVGTLALAREEEWSYEVPQLETPIETVSVGLDGTCMLLCEEGWREAMVGTLALYDRKGERQHTIYLGATPEYGKSKFLERLLATITHTKVLYPEATYVGLADGSASNWRFLSQHTQVQILDFYHAVGYLNALAAASFPSSQAKQEAYLEQCAHQLKHDSNAAQALYEQMLKVKQKKGLPVTIRNNLEAAITYFENHRHQMDYAHYRSLNYPIGSGVTEAACKTLVKQRLCNAGMRWKDHGASVILSLRALVLSKSHWQQFWHYIDSNGLPIPTSN